MIYDINDVGKFCKVFRNEVLKMTLEELSEKTGVKKTTLSSFENGRSTNYTHIIKYYNCGTDEQKQFFRDNIPM